jgi:hypothetical protein
MSNYRVFCMTTSMIGVAYLALEPSNDAPKLHHLMYLLTQPRHHLC